MIAALRAASAARRRRRVARSASAGGGEHEADEAGAGFGGVDGVVAGEAADLLQRGEPGERGLERGGLLAGRSSRGRRASASMRRGLRREPRSLSSAPAWARSSMSIIRPGPSLTSQGLAAAASVRLGEAAAHVGGVREDAARRRAARLSTAAMAAATSVPMRVRAGDDAGAGQRQMLPGPGLLGLVAAEGGERGGDRALRGRRGAGACRPCRGCPRPSARRVRRSAPG